MPPPTPVPSSPHLWRPVPTHFQIQLVPNLLETFCRAFLSEQAGAAHAGRYGEAECQVSGDCPLEQCQESPSTSADNNHDDDANKSRDGLEGGRVRPGKGSEERSGNVLRSASSSSSSSSVTTSPSSAVQRPECVRGRCGCPAGFHHIALDVGLERWGGVNACRSHLTIDFASVQGQDWAKYRTQTSACRGR